MYSSRLSGHTYVSSNFKFNQVMFFSISVCCGCNRPFTTDKSFGCQTAPLPLSWKCPEYRGNQTSRQKTEPPGITTHYIHSCRLFLGMHLPCFSFHHQCADLIPTRLLVLCAGHYDYHNICPKIQPDNYLCSSFALNICLLVCLFSFSVRVVCRALSQYLI